MIVEYKNCLAVKATFKNVTSMHSDGEHVVLVRTYVDATPQPSIYALPIMYSENIAILSLGMGEYVEVVNELAGS